jgi:putrescine aminotransferase
MMAISEKTTLQATDLAHLIHPLTAHQRLADTGPVVVMSGRGAEVTLADGRQVIDGSAGLWCVNVGHGREELARAAYDQASTLAFSPTFRGFSHPRAIELAARLSELAPGGLNHAFFVSGGSEANESAFKFVRLYWRLQGQEHRRVILSHERGYHGLAIATTTATRLNNFQVDFEPLAADFASIPAPYCYRCEAGVPCDPKTCEVITGVAMERTIQAVGPDNVAAVVVEPVIGTGGVIVPPDGYLRAVRGVCDRHGVLMIADEVITGFGRTGSWFGVDHDGVVPDMLVFAKGITSGYAQLGGVLVHDRVWEVLRNIPGDRPLMHGFTYSGHPVACAVALANLAVLDGDELIPKVAAQGRYLLDRLQAFLDLPDVGEVRGRGLMAAVELVADKGTRERFPAAAQRAARVGDATLERGVIMRPLPDDILLFSPPFVISDKQLDRMIDVVAESIVATAGSSG